MRKTLLFTLFLLGCSSHPILYPNKKFKQVGENKAKKDIKECEMEADEFLKSPQGKKIVKSAGAGAIVGSAVGAVTGLFTGNITGGIARGAAIGGTAGGTSAALSPNEVKQRFVNQCLSEKGYKVIGWD